MPPAPSCCDAPRRPHPLSRIACQRSVGDFIRSLDYRARKVIRALGVKDFYTLTALTPAAILAQPNVAETTLRNIREQLQALGLGLQRAALRRSDECW